MTYTLEVRDYAGNVSLRLTFNTEQEAYDAIPDYESDGTTCIVWRNDW